MTCHEKYMTASNRNTTRVYNEIFPIGEEEIISV
jgi:hypothetical protein